MSLLLHQVEKVYLDTKIQKYCLNKIVSFYENTDVIKNKYVFCWKKGEDLKNLIFNLIIILPASSKNFQQEKKIFFSIVLFEMASMVTCPLKKIWATKFILILCNYHLVN